MINERDIAQKFKATWKEHFPMLNPDFIWGLNYVDVKRINSSQIIAPPLIKYDLVAEAAFNLSALAYEKQESPASIFQDESRRQDIIESTAHSIRRLRNYALSDLNLSDIEVADIIGIAENTLEFIKKMGGQRVVFRPEIIGYGFIPNITADLAIDDTLFEIKTVNRNFKSSDLKQLFIYLALQQVSNAENWNNAGLYNPRKGTFIKFNVVNMIDKLTNSKSAQETFQNLLYDLNR